MMNSLRKRLRPVPKRKTEVIEKASSDVSTRSMTDEERERLGPPVPTEKGFTHYNWPTPKQREGKR
ncbi:MAG: hypothetical protein ACQEXQ_16065 [Bacillota bacterium]